MLLWIIRIILISILFIMIIIGGYFLANRQKYSKLLNNRPLNVFLVVVYNAICLLSAGFLPSDPTVFTKPLFFNSPVINISFQIFGIINLIIGIFLLIKTVIMRKSVGTEETEQGLITSGIYKFSRHPIYTGIFLVSFSLALSSINLDGMLILPFILIANLSQAKIEEKYDVGVIFKEEYDNYKKKTRIFGSIWFWLIISGVFIFLLLFSYLTYSPSLFDLLFL